MKKIDIFVLGPMEREKKIILVNEIRGEAVSLMMARRFQLSYITHIFISTILNTSNRGMECEFVLKMAFTKEKRVYKYL